MTEARRLVIHGRVQGVFFRAWTVATARELGLAGWVRNRRDGTVEALVQGDEAAVERFVERAGDGPPRASIERVETHEVEPDASLYAFAQLPTA
jgi:acylphosphatase